MTLPEHVLNNHCDHGVPKMQCETKQCDDDLSEMEEEAARELAARHAAGELTDDSAEAWEEDWNDSPRLGGMGPELEQMSRE